MTELKPWARFKLVSKQPAEETDHIYFYQSVTKVGRNVSRADVVLDMMFVSGVHCIVTLEGRTATGEPIVKIQDLSRNGIYVNEVRVGKSNTAPIQPNITIHFTKPGLQAKDVTPTVYKFEILKSGLTPENDRLRVERDRARARPPTSRTSTSSTSTSTMVVVTEQLTGKKQRRSTNQEGEEMEYEVTRTITAGGGAGDASPDRLVTPSKRRRLAGEDDDHLLSTTAQLQKSNQNLRQKLKEVTDRELKLKQSLSLVERDVDSLKDQLQVSEENTKVMENELTLKGDRLTDRETQVDALKAERTDLQGQVDQLKMALATTRSEAAKQAQINAELEADREKTEMEMNSITKHFETAQTKIRTLDEQCKALKKENTTLLSTVDSVETRTKQVEEGKRGHAEDNIVLRARLHSLQQGLNTLQKHLTNMQKVAAEEDHSGISQELEELQRSDNSILSSEQSQPAPLQEKYCPDTQPEMDDDDDDNDEDHEQTLDQDAAMARAAMSSTTTATTTSTGNVGPFSGFSSKITLPPNFSADLHQLDLDHQQPISTDLSMSLSMEDTAGLTEGKSSLSEGSSLSSHSSSKTPPAPPLPRPRMAMVSETVVTHKKETEVEESKGGDGSDNEEKEEEAEEEDDDDDDDDDDGTALPEGDEEEEAEEDKENTPVKADGISASAASASASRSTSAAAGAAGSSKASGPQAGQPGWLQMVVSHDDDKSEQVSTSEGGGIFDDETQLSIDQ